MRCLKHWQWQIGWCCPVFYCNTFICNAPADSIQACWSVKVNLLKWYPRIYVLFSWYFIFTCGAVKPDVHVHICDLHVHEFRLNLMLSMKFSQFREGRYEMTSRFNLTKISVRSPQQICIFIIQKKLFWINVSKTQFTSFWKQKHWRWLVHQPLNRVLNLGQCVTSMVVVIIFWLCMCSALNQGLCFTVQMMQAFNGPDNILPLSSVIDNDSVRCIHTCTPAHTHTHSHPHVDTSPHYV